jgi:hypothetical protein
VLEKQLCADAGRREQERSSLHHETAGRRALPRHRRRPGKSGGLVRNVNYRTEEIDSGARGGRSEPLVPHI